MTAVLVRHPRGDLLVDIGFGRAIDTQIELMPLFFRLTTSHERLATAADRLASRGYDRTRLRAIVLTHAHWDHASGVADFPGTPVWVPAAERQFIADGGWLTAVARSARDARYEIHEEAETATRGSRAGVMKAEEIPLLD
jgi:glyoxylase-like metal-dependent hydrolase (beta-lactamase superfamily II)